MQTLRRLTLLGMFAAGGVGLAIALASSHPPKPTPSETASAAALPASETPEADPVLARPVPDDAPEATSEPPREAKLEIPASTALVEPPLASSPKLETPTEPQPAVVRNDPAPREPAEQVPRPEASSLAEAADPLLPTAPEPEPLPAPRLALIPLTPEASLPLDLPQYEARYVEPEPPIAQQILPGMDSQTLQQAVDLLQRHLGGRTAGPGLAPPPMPRAAAPQPTPAVAQPEPKPEPIPAPKAVVRNAPGEEDGGKLVMHFRNNDIREVLEMLSEQAGLNILASANVKGTVSATLTGVDVDSALDAILRNHGLLAKRDGNYIFIGTPADFDSMEQSFDTIGTRLYRPNYVSATELQTLITPLLTQNIGVISVSSAAEVGIGSDDSGAGGNGFAGGEVVLVRDYEAVLAQIDQFVSEIDVRPLQVAIEAMILSVKLSDTNRFGVNFELLRNKNNIRLGWESPLATLADIKFDGGLKFGFLDSSLAGFIDALESVGETSVIASPTLMVLNKHRAEIQIGEKKGYVSTTVTETSSTQSVEFLDIGAQLRLRPFISSDGLIRMEVHPELSDGAVDTESGFTLPNKEVTQVTTNIMVRDGCTVVIGGLLRDQIVNTVSQIPVLGNLPWLGVAFRNTTVETERREVLVLITPHIVYDGEMCAEGEKSAAEFQRRQDTQHEKVAPLNKRTIARRYFRRAQAAWAEGDRDRALRFAEMAVHFDPLSRAAIDLRSDIWQGRSVGAHALNVPMAVASPANPLEGPEIADWLLEDLEQGPPARPLLRHPLDPGRPGEKTDLVRPRRLP